METLKVGELKTNFSNVLQKIRAGKEIVISYGKTGEKIAVLVPYQKYISAEPRPLGILKGKANYKIKKDFEMSDKELLSS